MRCKKFTVFLSLLIFSASSLLAQQVSEKKDIAVFKLGHAQYDIPMPVLSDIDEEVKGVFINIGRFNVLGMTQRLEEGDVNDFIDRIKQYKQENVEIPREVQMGREFFTEADLNRLIGSFIVVIPSISNFFVEQEKGGDYQATVKTAFNFINVEEGRAFAHFIIETSSTDELARVAVKDAVNAIPMRLTYEIRKIPEFQLRTGILEVRRGEVYLEFGRDMGIKLGDEFLIVISRVLDSGKTFSTDKGLIIIKEVSDEVSVGKVIYSHGRPQAGDQLAEVPRLGLDTIPYLHVTLLSFDEEAKTTVLAGIRTGLTRGFYSFRPFIGLEIPFRANILWGLPFNIYVGGEYDLYIRRLQIIPMAAFGIGGAYLWYLEKFGANVDDPFLLTHIGGMANITLTYLLNKNFKFVLEAGYLHWFSLDPTKLLLEEPLFFEDYSGIFIGGGLSIKY